MVIPAPVFKRVGAQVRISTAENSKTSQRISDLASHVAAHAHTPNINSYQMPYDIKRDADLDCSIPRPKLPKTALPSDVRSKLGLERRRLLKSSNYDDRALSKGMKIIEKKPFLKKGSGTIKKRTLNIYKKDEA